MDRYNLKKREAYMYTISRGELEPLLNYQKPKHIPLTPIRGCSKCMPKQLEEQGPSKGIYRCKCRMIVRVKLIDKTYKQ